MPYLIAVTPRAGRWNHRYLVPPHLDLGNETLGRLTRLAGQEPQGAAWLAVSRDAIQVDSGRSGQELLILGDLDVQKLDSIERERLLDLLRKRQADLAELVTKKVDWDREGRVDPVPRPEIAEWYRVDFGSLNLPKSDDTQWSPSRVTAMSSRNIKINRKHILVTSSMVTFGLLAAMMFFKPWQNDSEEEFEASVCTIEGVHGESVNTACYLTDNEFNRLWDLLMPQAEERNKEKLEVELNKIRSAQEQFRSDLNLDDLSKRGVHEGNFAKALMPKKGSGNCSRVLSAEIFGADKAGSDDNKLTLEEYVEVLNWEAGILPAWRQLKKVYPDNIKTAAIDEETLSGSERVENLSLALCDIRDFLKNLPKESKTFLYALLLNDDTAICLEELEKKDDRATIDSRLDCFLDKEAWNNAKAKNEDIKSDDQNIRTLFDLLLDLRSPHDSK